MTIRLVYVNHEQIEYEREMEAWAQWILREGRCRSCEAIGAEFENVNCWPLCADCAIDPEDFFADVPF
jgi:hypothetical protein